MLPRFAENRTSRGARPPVPSQARSHQRPEFGERPQAICHHGAAEFAFTLQFLTGRSLFRAHQVKNFHKAGRSRFRAVRGRPFRRVCISASIFAVAGMSFPFTPEPSG